jgi:hypothetical protein
MAKAKKFVPIHKPGYVEAELRRIATDPYNASAEHSRAVFAEALLMLLARLPPSEVEK